jgi:hypothetical protein
LVFLLGCEGKVAELVEKTNTWEFSELQDKIANKLIYFAKAKLIDDGQPTKFVTEGWSVHNKNKRTSAKIT